MNEKFLFFIFFSIFRIWRCKILKLVYTENHIPTQPNKAPPPSHGCTITPMDRESPAERFPNESCTEEIKKRWDQGNRTTTLFSISRFSWGTGGKNVTKLPNSDHNCFVEYPGEDMRSAPRVSLTSPVTLNERYTWG